MADLEEFGKITWSYLTNVRMTWEYDGIAYLLRDAGIPLYGFDRGTIKMNHPIAAIALPPSKDVNFGVDLYVPQGDLVCAKRLVNDKQRIKEAARLEEVEGDAHHRRFERAARAFKEQHAEERRARRREKIAAAMARIGIS